MNSKRRNLLQTGGGMTLLTMLAAAGWLQPRDAHWRRTHGTPRRSTRSRWTTRSSRWAAARRCQSKAITFTQTPDIAENGAVVPVGVTSAIPNTQSIAILIEKNPNVLTAVFDIPPGTEPSITTRVKMGQSSNIYALVKADGKYYIASKEVKVTLGGCGG